MLHKIINCWLTWLNESCRWMEFHRGGESDRIVRRPRPYLTYLSCICSPVSSRAFSRSHSWSSACRREHACHWFPRLGESDLETGWFQVAVSLGSGSVLLISSEPQKTTAEWKLASQNGDPPRRTQGLVQLRVVSLDEDMDIQEASCYIHEGIYVGYLRLRIKT